MIDIFNKWISNYTKYNLKEMLKKIVMNTCNFCNWLNAESLILPTPVLAFISGEIIESNHF